MGRWTAKKKERIKQSRIEGTQALCDILLKMDHPPGLLICASAIGYYGNRPGEILTEKSVKGTGFLSDVCEEWENITTQVSVRGIRTVNMRFGVVYSLEGGALKEMLLPFKLGLGGKLGAGKHYISWVSLNELMRMIDFVIHTNDISGPVNAVGQHPLTNEEQTHVLGKILKRPTWLTMPEWLVKCIFGQLGEELLLADTRVIPEKLKSLNFHFKEKDFEQFFELHNRSSKN